MAEISKNISGKSLKLNGLADYQKGSVVSKEVVRGKTGTITVFSFDKGQGLSEHKAPFDAFVYIIDGAAEISIGGKPRRVKKGEMILLPANVPHALAAVQRFKMLLVMIRS